MSEPISHSLEAFHSTISVMLVDKVLTREEKRLIIKLASALGLNEDEPSQIYQAVRTGPVSYTHLTLPTNACV